MMKLKFLAGPGPQAYNVKGQMIDSIDTSVFVEGAQFIGSGELRKAGLFGMHWDDGVLHVTLAQPCLNYECQPIGNGHYWQESEWIDAADYDPNRCYIVATSAPEGAEYVKRENGWTVALPQAEEEPTP